MSTDQYSNVVIGLEIHIQLNYLKTKLWCSCSTDYRDAAPNTHVCPICLGHPGTLPVANKEAINTAIRLALSLNCDIPDYQYFYRKNYFYPDMSKSFQVTQYNRGGGVPFGNGGYVNITHNEEEEKIILDRIHIEGDPGKLTHQGTMETSPYTLIDYNRCGIALIEIVTTPCMSNPEEARAFCNKLKTILTYAKVNDPTMEGAFRVDANISIKGHERVEIKNIGSVKDVEYGLKYEIKRHKNLLKRGLEPGRDTRHFDGHTTQLLRRKEVEDDYRYFPEPDLTPFEVTAEMIQKIQANLPEHPDLRMKRFIKEYDLSTYDAEILISEKAHADFFEECAQDYKDYKNLANWINNNISRRLNDENMALNESKLQPNNFLSLLKLIKTGVISRNNAKKLLPDVINGKNPEKLVKKKGLSKITDREELSKLADEALAANPDILEKLKQKPKVFQALVGHIMKETRGQADHAISTEILKEKLGLD